MFLPRAHCWSVVWWEGHEHTQPLTSSTMHDYVPVIVDCPILMSDTGMRDIVM